MTGALIVTAMVAAALVLLAREEAVLRGNGDRLWRSLGDLGSTIAHAPARILHPVGHSADQWADEWDDEWDDHGVDRGVDRVADSGDEVDAAADEPAARDTDAEA
ncbi:hypothetical protein [Nocardioides pelophilus]|uniref:hypothetical protein n=1 Tax=Nocardioides pelophilus TaxID=2172019 RepID=UPI001600B71D|nr:hypothetical protein [Nocardioides pelophilus]